MVDELAIITSANIDKEYAGPKLGDNKFLDLSIYIPVTQSLEDLFHRHAKRHGVYLPSFYNTLEFAEFYQTLVFEPEFRITEIQNKILEQVRNAQKSITIMQGYYQDIPIFNKTLEEAISRGVKVTFITSRRRDQPCYKWLKNCFVSQKLKSMGAEVMEYNQDIILHAKGYLFDDQSFIIGSFNHDKWSWYLNNELSIYSDHKHYVSIVRSMFDKIINKCCEINEQTTTKDIFM